MRTRVAIGLAVLAAVAIALVLRPALFMREASSSRDTCRDVPASAYIPDVTIDEGRGVAYLAYLDVSKRATGRAPRGTVMLTELNVTEPHVRAALVTDPPDFQPVALSLYAPAQGARRLLVIDRGTGAQSTVRIFQQSPSGAFELVKSVQDARLTNPVVIEATGPDQFYARNDVETAALGSWLRRTFGLSRTEVVYYDGTQMKAMPGDAKQAALPPRGQENRRVYASEKIRKRVEVTELDSGNSSVRLCAANALTTS
jgi:hypothetical protein